MSDDAPLSLFPRHPQTERPGVVQKVGKRTLGAYEQTFGLAETLLGALASPFEPGEAARSVANRLAVRQVFFTGFEALPLVSVIEAVQALRLVQADLIAADTELGLAWARLGRAIGSYEAMIP